MADTYTYELADAQQQKALWARSVELVRKYGYGGAP